MARTLCKNKLRRVCALFLFACVAFFVNHSEAKEQYSMGLIGINSVVPGAKNNNITAYFDLQEKRDPMEFAQDYFTEMFNTEFTDIKSLKTLDMTERTTLLRRDEVILQLTLGDPSKAVKLFPANPDYLVYGNIDSFTVTRRESLGSNNVSVEVQLSVRIFDVETNKVALAVTGRGTSATHSVDLSANGDKISIERWREALDAALMEIIKKIKREVV